MNCPKHGEQPTICRFCDEDVVARLAPPKRCRDCDGTGNLRSVGDRRFIIFPCHECGGTGYVHPK